VLALGIRYLCGWSAASSAGNRDAPEWPPHPDRVFMAMAAAYFESDGPPDERAALEWLSAQPPPALACTEASPRRTTTTYVPVNDVAAPRVREGREPSDDQLRAGRAVLPEERPRHPRTFPRAMPRDPTVFAIWPAADASVHRPALERLCRKVTHIGHSSSLVQMWVAGDPPNPTWVPASGGRQALRVAPPGRLGELERLYRLDPPQRPRAAMWQAYGEVAVADRPVPASGAFGPDVLVLRQVEGPRLGLESTLLLTRALRAALLKHLDGTSPPEWVSGHTRSGAPSRAAHLAYLPLAHVGSPHADGHLLGAGIAVPASVDWAEAAAVLRPVLQQAAREGLHVFDGRAVDVRLVLETGAWTPMALRPWMYSAAPDGARRWASVTPVVLPRYPKRDSQVDEIAALSCEQAGLPPPASVWTSPVSWLVGAPHARSFAPFRDRGSGASRYHVHVAIAFDRPVRGPILLGAGRYFGYGLLRPVDERES